MQEVTELNLKSGIRVWVKPLSRFARTGIIEMSEKLFPYPDKSLYEVALPEDVAIPGMKIPAEENKDYQVLVVTINRARGEYTSSAILNLCVAYPDFPEGKSGVMAHFAPWLEELRRFTALPEDTWEATLRFGVIQSVQDEALIMQVVREELPITEAEISAEMKVFRPVVQVSATRLLDSARKTASGVKGEGESKP